jgi:hypothetical protein
MTSAQLREHHNRCQANAVQLFDTAKKMGGQKLAENFRGRLLEGIQVRTSESQWIKNETTLWI